MAIRSVAFTSAALGCMALAQTASAQSVDGLDVPSDWYFGVARSISGNGAFIGGYGLLEDGGFSKEQAVRWTADGALTILGSIDNQNGSFVYAVNNNGTAVGIENDGDFFPQPIIWDAAGNASYLTITSGGGAFDLSADGSTIVGYGLGFSGNVPVYWDDLGNPHQLVTGSWTTGRAVAVDDAGTTFAGHVGNNGTGDDGRAAMWTVGGGFVELPSLVSGATAMARGISADGTVIVGRSGNGSTDEAVRWIGGTAEGLGMLDGANSSEALAVNGGGTVIVGISNDPGDGNVAVRWTETEGMRSVSEILTSNGVDMGGWLLWQAYGVTDDGETIVGAGFGPDGRTAWIARDLGIITVPGTQRSIASLGAMTEGMHDTVDGLLATQREYALQQAAGPGAADSRGLRIFGYVEGSTAATDADTEAGFGQIGASYALGEATSVGGSFGYGGSKADMSYDGAAEADTLSGSAYAAFTPATGPQAVFSGTVVGFSDMTVDRGYENGSGLSRSRGETEGVGYGASVRVGWAFAADPKITITPFGTYQVTHVSVDGYTETTGPFPASIDDIDDTAEIARLGIEGRYAFSPRSWLWGSAAWAHRVDDSSAAVDAQLAGLFGVSGQRFSLDQDWAEVTAGVSLALPQGARMTASATGFLPEDSDLGAAGRVGVSQGF